MSQQREQMLDFLSKVSGLVEELPWWKRNLLEEASSSTNKYPRKPILEKEKQMTISIQTIKDRYDLKTWATLAAPSHEEIKFLLDELWDLQEDYSLLESERNALNSFYLNVFNDGDDQFSVYSHDLVADIKTAKRKIEKYEDSQQPKPTEQEINKYQVKEHQVMDDFAEKLGREVHKSEYDGDYIITKRWEDVNVREQERYKKVGLDMWNYFMEWTRDFVSGGKH